jgi:threonine aldolase
MPSPSLVVIENTYMAASGAPISASEMKTLCATAHAGDVRVHVDGARIWNAAIALGVAPKEIVADADTVMFCLSKGLSAPVGSLLCGTAALIAEARVHRQRFGGGMRQAGIIAAAGVVALETMVERLADDHERARRLADAIAVRFPGSLDPSAVRTNIVCADLHALPDKFVERLADAGVQCDTIDPRTVRFVTHKDVDDAAIDRTIAALREVA